MIAHFPAPYPEELFYSVIARFAERMAYPALHSCLFELLGDRHGVPAVKLPNKLDKLITSLPSKTPYTADFFIQNHTLLPFYAPFLSQRNLDLIIVNMKSGDVRTTHLHAGIIAGGVVPPVFFRSCAFCDRESIKTYGEPYWHRLHQIKGVEVCPVHRIFLESSDVRLRGLCPKDSLISSQSAQRNAVVRKLDLRTSGHRALLGIAESAAWLLRQSALKPGLVQLNRSYRELLDSKDYICPRGRIRLHRLRGIVNQTFSGECLAEFNCDLVKAGDGGWLGRLLRETDHSIAPLRHLLVLATLKTSAEQFFALVSTAKPTAKPKSRVYPYLNHICPRFGMPVISDSEVKRAIVGRARIFECPDCGHRSSRATDGQSVIRVVDFGSRWLERLKTLWPNKSLTLSAVASQLHADMRSVQNYALKIRLEFPRHGPSRMTLEPKSRRVNSEGRSMSVEDRRIEWCYLRKNHPAVGMSELHRLAPALYTWIYRHDREWMIQNSPERKRRVLKNDRVDWAARDEEIFKRVVEVAIRIKTEARPPRRVTVRSIGYEMGIPMVLQMQKDKLPKTKAALAAQVESTESFILRRLEWTVETLKSRQSRVNRSDMMRVAGVAARALQIPSVYAAVELAAKELGCRPPKANLSEAA